jgi:hypothetical protein
MRNPKTLSDHFKTPMDLLSTFGVLYAGLQLAWPPASWWWWAISWGAASGALICWLAFAVSGERPALRWGTLWGLAAGSFASLPMQELGSVAPVFRIFLLLALRRALRLPSSGSWAVGTLVGGAALGAYGEAVSVLLMLAILWSLVEFVAGYIRTRRAKQIAACIAVPALCGLGGSFGFDPFLAGVIIFVACFFVLIVHSTVVCVSLALPATHAPTGAPSL